MTQAGDGLYRWNVVSVCLHREMTREQIDFCLSNARAQILAISGDANDTLTGAVFLGFDDDPRELNAIPEARQLAQHAIEAGIMPLLAFSFSIPELMPEQVQAIPLDDITPPEICGLGALEVYCLARDILTSGGDQRLPAQIVSQAWDLAKKDCHR